MRLPDSEWRHWPGMDGLLEALDAEGGKIRYVGGAVRDSLLGLTVQDVDCATVFPPQRGRNTSGPGRGSANCCWHCRHPGVGISLAPEP